MSSDLLPEWLNVFLDDVETSLCLPILIVIVFCTVQFIFNHTIDIGYTFYQNIMQKSDEEDGEIEDSKGGMIDKMKEFLSNLPFVSNIVNSKIDQNTLSPAGGTNSGEEEWDYCEEDDE